LNPRSPSRTKFNPRSLRAWKSRLRGESGSSLIETALTLVILCVVLFGIIEMSLAAYSYHYVSDAAREATRYAIVRGYDWTNSTTGALNYCDTSGTYASAGCIASTSDIQSYVRNLGFPGIDSNNLAVSSGCATTPGGTFSTGITPTCIAAGVVQVTVSYPFTFGLPGMKAFSYNLSSSSQMVISQ
jgi:Flp pilus assembly protein TadG